MEPLGNGGIIELKCKFFYHNLLLKSSKPCLIYLDTLVELSWCSDKEKREKYKLSFKSFSPCVNNVLIINVLVIVLGID